MNMKSTDLRAMQRQFKEALTIRQLRQLARQLGIKTGSLKACGAGWDHDAGAYTFPERDGRGRVIGIHIRSADTAKRWMVPGSTRGLYYTKRWRQGSGPILIPEGVSDTAALLSHGLSAVGRPSCSGGADLLAELLEDTDQEIIVVGENDQKTDGRWPGKDGARKVAQSLANLLDRDIRWVLPPEGFKDVRDWLCQGASDVR